MGKAKLAMRVADTFDTSIQKAQRFVDDVGPQTAENAARITDEVDSTRSFPWKKVLAGTTAAGVGGGALYWREQDVRRAEAAATQADSFEEAMANIVESDLPPELKRELADSASSAAAGNGGTTDGMDLLDRLGDLWPGGFELDLTGIALILIVAMIAYTAVSAQVQEEVQ